MINTIFATKLRAIQGFDQKGKRWPLTRLKLEPLVVSQLKTMEKDGYWAVQLIVGKKAKKRREVRLDQKPALKVKDKIDPQEVLTEGDLVKATAYSKGKGFTGVMKRWGFKGGPRTHGQSDRQRAPGSIGQRTDPGRVWKGKKMPGHSGHKNTTVRNLVVMGFELPSGILYLRGLVPGPIKGLVKITKLGKSKSFSPLYKDKETREKEGKNG